MPHASRLAVIAVGLFLSQALCSQAAASEEFPFYHENVLGTSLELLVRADSPQAARQAEQRALAEIDRLALIFSGYDPSSEFSRWQAAPRSARTDSPELYEVLEASDHWRTRSGGAFDPRVEVLSRLWARCTDLGRLPTHDESTAATTLLAAPAWRLDPLTHKAERLSNGPLSLNGIAKGYIVERACEAAFQPLAGIRDVLLNVGGDLRVRGPAGRTVGIAAPWADSESSEPFLSIEVNNRSVATSGKSRRGFQINNQWYSHVFDPRTARPVERVIGVTVVANRGADADALAKICGVLEPEDSLRLVNSLPDVDCLIIAADGQVARSDGWHRLERPRPVPLAIAMATGQDPPSSPPKPASGTKAAEQAKSETKPRRAPPGTSSSSWSSTSRSTIPRPRRAAIGGRTSPSGLKTTRESRCAPWRCGSRWAGPGHFSGFPTSSTGTRATKSGSSPKRRISSSRSPDRPASRKIQADLGRQGQPRQAARRRRLHDL